MCGQVNKYNNGQWITINELCETETEFETERKKDQHFTVEEALKIAQNIQDYL